MSAHEHHHRADPSGDGTVVLDIGGDVGALVVYTPEQLVATEIDIMRAGETHPAMHTAVRLREVPGRRTYAAVYPAVPAGDYVLPATAGLPSIAVTVTGGRVTEVHWSAASCGSAPDPPPRAPRRWAIAQARWRRATR